MSTDTITLDDERTAARTPGNAQALDQFHNALCSTYGTFSLATLPERLASGELALRSGGAFATAHVATSNLLLSRAEHALRAEFDHYIFANLQVNGRTLFKQFGCEASARRRDIVLVNAQRALDIVVSQPTSVVVAFHFDDSMLVGCPPSADICGRKIDGTRPVGRMLVGVLESLLIGEGSGDEQDIELTRDIVRSLLQRALQVREPLAVPVGHSRKLERMRQWASTRLDDPDLGPAAMAAEFGVSRRQLYRLFEGEGTTPSAWLWRLRLDLAHACLSNPVSGTRSITDIAFSLGFNDAAHFSRAFRRCFGVAPREYRRS